MALRTSYAVMAPFLALVMSACTVETTSSGKDDGSGGGSNDEHDGGAGGARDGSGGKSSTGGKSGGAAGTGTTDDGGGSGGDGGGGSVDDAGAPDGSTGSDADGGNVTGDAGVTVAGEGCAAEATPNEDRDHSTPYALGSEYRGCLQSAADIDFYTYTAPSTPAAGGVMVVKLTDVGEKGSLNVTVQSVTDNGEIMSTYDGGGTSIFMWFNAAPSQKYRIKVEHFTFNDKTPYTLKIDYVKVNDTFEPNDARTAAKPITVDTPIHAYMFAGYENSTGVASETWDDWYQVTLPAKTAKVLVSELTPDINGEIYLYDADGVQLSNVYEANDGASVVLEKALTKAGTYYVKVRPFTGPTTHDTTKSNPPAYATTPYTLTITAQ